MSTTSNRRAVKSAKAGEVGTNKLGAGKRPARKQSATKPPTKNKSQLNSKPKPAATKQTDSTTLSALDAAVVVLETEKRPMGAKALVAAMAERGLWSSPGGKTLAATLYSSIIREINNKGDASRFKKVDRGQFTLNVKKGGSK